jgi:hypothetical protein
LESLTLAVQSVLQSIMDGRRIHECGPVQRRVRARNGELPSRCIPS